MFAIRIGYVLVNVWFSQLLSYDTKLLAIRRELLASFDSITGFESDLNLNV